MLATIVPQTDLTNATLHEVECLAAEIFSTTYGMTWGQAITEAVNSFADLAGYGVDWDLDALVLDNLDALPE